MNSFKWSATAIGDLQHIAEYIRDTYPAQEHSTVGNVINKANLLT